jgi:hypothetical protein
MASVSEWLDAVSAGYGAKFGACFDDIGFESVSDVKKHLGDDKALVELEESLRQAGAKSGHVLKIKDAIAVLREGTLSPHRPGGPAPSQGTPKKNAVVDTALVGKTFGCFLSHHKASCAMEGVVHIASFA